jgi:nitroimidazol reductase NimA-like FMN-containing flavoprotein (pyridoxamine 5'-phosphate oxidase superfamily)
MDAAALAAFLDEVRYGVLATSRPDGRAHATPIGFVHFERALWIASVAGARLRNLRHLPYAALVVADGEGRSHRAVIVEGDVRLHRKFEDVPEEVPVAWRDRYGSEPSWTVAFIELLPTRLFSFRARPPTGHRP